jgi:hypothetical protein
VELLGTDRPLHVRPNYARDWCSQCFSRALGRATGLRITTLDLSWRAALMAGFVGLMAGLSLAGLIK